MAVTSVRFFEKYSTEWFILTIMSGREKLGSRAIDQSYWEDLFQEFPEHEQNILEAKEMLDVLSCITIKEPPPLKKAEQVSIWEKIVQEIKDEKGSHSIQQR